MVGGDELVVLTGTGGFGSHIEAGVRVGDGSLLPKLEDVARLPDAPILVGRIQCLVALPAELLVPALRQRAQDLRRLSSGPCMSSQVVWDSSIGSGPGCPQRSRT
jgi:hypothetical protein